MSVVVEQDRSGHLYYDLMIDQPKEKAMPGSSGSSPDYYSGRPLEPNIASESKASPDYYSGHLLDSNLEHEEQGVTLDSVGGMVSNLYMDWRGGR